MLVYLGIDRGFISSERASNKADMAYLYYLRSACSSRPATTFANAPRLYSCEPTSRSPRPQHSRLR